MRTRRSLRSAAGFTVVELAIASFVALTALVIVYQVISTSTRTQKYINALDYAQTRAERVVADLRAAGFASRRIFQDDAEGQSYLAALSTGSFPPNSDTHLPIVDASGRLEADDAGVRRTGNAMLLACEAPPRDVLTTASRVRRVDLVRFVAVFQSQRARKVVQSLSYQTDLMRFASRLYADKASLDAITDATDKHDAVLAMRTAGITRCWVSGAAIASAFFDLNSDGTIATTAVTSPVIDTPADSPIRNLLGDSHTTVAANDSKLKVPALAEIPVATPTFPGGFEVKVVGPSGGRQVLVRLVLLAGISDGADAIARTTRIFSARDL